MWSKLRLSSQWFKSPLKTWSTTVGPSKINFIRDVVNCTSFLWRSLHKKWVGLWTAAAPTAARSWRWWCTRKGRRRTVTMGTRGPRQSLSTPTTPCSSFTSSAVLTAPAVSPVCWLVPCVLVEFNEPLLRPTLIEMDIRVFVWCS
jgi:hypothetical protein